MSFHIDAAATVRVPTFRRRQLCKWFLFEQLLPVRRWRRLLYGHILKIDSLTVIISLTYIYIAQECPGDLIFNPSTSRCDDRSNVAACQVFECPDSTGQYRNPLSCNSYYLCADSIPYLIVSQILCVNYKEEKTNNIWSIIHTRVVRIVQVNWSLTHRLTNVTPWATYRVANHSNALLQAVLIRILYRATVFTCALTVFLIWLIAQLVWYSTRP